MFLFSGGRRERSSQAVPSHPRHGKRTDCHAYDIRCQAVFADQRSEPPPQLTPRFIDRPESWEDDRSHYYGLMV